MAVVEEVVELRSNQFPRYHAALLHCKLIGNILDVVVYFSSKEEMVNANIKPGDILSGVFYVECYLEDN